MNQDWKQDERVKQMSADKIQFLTDFSDKVSKLPKNQLMPFMLSINTEAQKKGINFSNQETDLLVSIISSGMNPAERKKMDTLRMLSQKLSGKKRS